MVSSIHKGELWEKGDFTRIAAAMRVSGEALVGELGISADIRVLDLGCGDGTTALPAALSGAEVLGVDSFDLVVTIFGAMSRRSPYRSPGRWCAWRSRAGGS